MEDVQALLRSDIKWREYWSEYKSWQTYEDYYRGHFQGSGLVPVNVYFPNVRSTVPQVYYRNPKFYVSEEVVGGELRAKILQTILNWLVKRLRYKQEVKLTAQDCWLFGTGFLVHGYDTKHGVAPGPLGSGVVTKKGRRLDWDTQVIKGTPWTMRTHPADVVLGWGTTRQRAIRRYTTRVLRPVDDVKEDDSYSASARKEVQPSNVSLGLSEERTGGGESAPDDMVYVYSMHDFQERKVMIFTSGSKKFLYEGPDELANALDAPAITVLAWNPNSRSLWGVPESKQIEAFQLEANTSSTLAAKSRRINIPKFFYDRTVISEEEMEKWLSEDVGAGIGIDGDPRDVILPIEARPSMTLAGDIEVLQHQVRGVIGMSESRGGSYSAPAKRVTSREVSATEYGTDIRVADKRDAVSDMLIDTAEKWADMIFNYWTEYRIIRTPDAAIPYNWVLFKGSELRSVYSYTINPEDAQPQTETSRKLEAQILAPALIKASQAVPGLDVRELLREILSRFPGWDVSKILPPSEQEARQYGSVGLLRPDGSIVPYQGARG